MKIVAIASCLIIALLGPKSLNESFSGENDGMFSENGSDFNPRIQRALKSARRLIEYCVGIGRCQLKRSDISRCRYMWFCYKSSVPMECTRTISHGRMFSFTGSPRLKN
jgi:hypothetical protein